MILQKINLLTISILMDVSKIAAGKNPPAEINVFVEIPAGSAVKYELDKDSGVIKVDRILHTAMVYPFNYGFIPQTHAADGDPEDVLLVSSVPMMPGSFVSARPIGLLEMDDEAGGDNKIIAVPVAKVDPQFAKIEDVADLDDSTKNKIKHFFETYKQLEPNKWVKTKAFKGQAIALAEIKKSLQ
jgi:inorganic pyrophosphatase